MNETEKDDLPMWSLCSSGGVGRRRHGAGSMGRPRVEDNKGAIRMTDPLQDAPGDPNTLEYYVHLHLEPFA